MEKLDKKKEEEAIVSLSGNCINIVSRLLFLQVELPYESPDLAGFICDLDKKGKIHFLKSCKEALENNSDVFRIAHLMKSPLPDMEDIDIPLLIEILEIFSLKMKGDLAAGLFHSAIEERAERFESFTDMLEKDLIGQTDEGLLGYLLASYIGLSKVNFTSAFERMIKLVNSSHSTRRALGIRGLGSLGERSIEKKKEILSIVQLYNMSEDIQISSNSAYTTFRLISIFDDLKIEAKKLSKSERGEVQYEVSSYLRFDGNCSENWQKELLFNLIKKTKSKNKGITDNFDSILYTAIKKDNNFDLAKRFINEWINTRKDTEIVNFKLDSTFSMTLRLLSVKNNFISLLLAEWFNHDDFKFHKAVTHLVDYLKLHKIKPVLLDKDYLSELDYDSCLYTIRKILSYVLEFNHSIQYVCSFFQRENLDEKLYDLISSVLAEHFGYNYLGRTVEYLEKFDTSKFDSDVKDYVKAVLKELSKRKQELQDLTPINELRPEVDTLMKIESERQKLFAQAFEKAPRSSIMDFVTKVKIKEGVGWFSYMHGKYSEVSNMKRYSQSIELPKADVLDEVGAIIERQGFRAAKRGQQ